MFKWRIMFIWGITEDLTRNTTSEIALRDCCKELWEVPEFLPKKTQKNQVVKIKRLLPVKEKQISQVEFTSFLCMEWCKNLGLMKLFLWSAPYLW